MSKISFIHNNFKYQVSADPVIYTDEKGSVPSGNWILEILTPEGFISCDFYPESNDLFTVELEESLADELSSILINLGSVKMCYN